MHRGERLLPADMKVGLGLSTSGLRTILPLGARARADRPGRRTIGLPERVLTDRMAIREGLGALDLRSVRRMVPRTCRAGRRMTGRYDNC